MVVNYIKNLIVMGGLQLSFLQSKALGGQILGPLESTKNWVGKFQLNRAKWR
jgi:hypothetical protein